MIDGPTRTALEEIYAARLKEERMCEHNYGDLDPANFNDTVKPMHYYPGIDRALHEGYRWEPEDIVMELEPPEMPPLDRSPWVLWCGAVAPSILDRYLKGQPWHRRLRRYLRALWRKLWKK